MATKKMVKKPVMKKGGYLKKKGDGGGWHAPMALPENPKTQSPMVGPMNNPANNNIQNVPNAASSAKKANLQSVPSAGSSNVLNAADKIKIGMQNTPKQKKGGATKKTYKTGGMVNANANLKATKSPGSKGVKSGVNPKAAASKTAKKPSASRSKAPKKATPGRK
jgi:hypothetical protein